MQWYHNELTIDGIQVEVYGYFENSTVRIVSTYAIETEDEIAYYHLTTFEKPIQMWAYQEVTAEGVRQKYLGKVKKIESKLPQALRVKREANALLEKERQDKLRQ